MQLGYDVRLIAILVTAGRDEDEPGVVVCESSRRNHVETEAIVLSVLVEGLV